LDARAATAPRGRPRLTAADAAVARQARRALRRGGARAEAFPARAAADVPAARGLSGRARVQRHAGARLAGAVADVALAVARGVATDPVGAVAVEALVTGVTGRAAGKARRADAGHAVARRRA